MRLPSELTATISFMTAEIRASPERAKHRAFAVVGSGHRSAQQIAGSRGVQKIADWIHRAAAPVHHCTFL
jgi:hypothetical protein